jgi:molybdate/tungstate transport system substrate-binding protein
MMKRRVFVTAALAALGAPRLAFAAQRVDVLYAASLITPMEGPIKEALLPRGIDFVGQPGGSQELVNFIIAGLRSPDVFISADASLNARLGTRVLEATNFAGTSLGIGWAPASKYAALFASVAGGKVSMLHALATPGLLIGRTDPRLDPKGKYTIEAMKILAGARGERRILGPDENPAQIFPEEDLLARVDTGQADVGFFYRTEAIARRLRFVALPGRAALTNRIVFSLALMRNAPHPVQARAFTSFVLDGPGRTILEKAGLVYLTRSRGAPSRTSATL